MLNRLKTGVMISGGGGARAAWPRNMNATMRAASGWCTPTPSAGACQIRDDMLDVEGDQAVFGKPIGSDVQEGKVTFVDVMRHGRLPPGRWPPAPRRPRQRWPDGRTMVSSGSWRTEWWAAGSEQ